MLGLKKYLDYTFNKKYEEVKISLLLTIVFISILVIIDLYPNFFSYQDFIIEISIDILLSQIALMGVLITALALLVTLFNNSEQIKTINELDQEQNVDELLNDFPYISILILIHIIYSMILVLLMKSSLKIPPFYLFFLVIALYLYLLMNILIRVTFLSFITVNVFRGIRSLVRLSLIDKKEMNSFVNKKENTTFLKMGKINRRTDLKIQKYSRKKRHR